MLGKESNELLTQVGSGTPMGELMRRYWHPIAAGAELLDEPTKEVTLLGEELVLYKDRSGTLGLIGRRCAHRRVSLVYGVPEEDGLRCQYHGWKYDETGQCIEQPFEETVNPQARFKDRVKLAGYPVQELGGLIFAYLGPQPAPLLPNWAPFLWNNVVRDIAITVLPCNWLQCQENSLDPVHTEWLHGYYGSYMRQRMDGPGQGKTGDGLIPGLQNAHQRIRFRPFKYGIIKNRLLAGADESHDDWQIGHPVFFPNILCVGSPEHVTMQFRVPIDDTHTYHVSLYSWRAAPGHSAPKQDVIPYRYVPLRDEDGRFSHQTVTFNQDYMAWASQGPIAVRDEEKLGESDAGIIMFRKMLRDQVELVDDGGEPINVFREPGSNMIDDVPLERLKFAAKRPLRELKYHPAEAGYSAAAAEIEQVLATYADAEPELVGS